MSATVNFAISERQSTTYAELQQKVRPTSAHRTTLILTLQSTVVTTRTTRFKINIRPLHTVFAVSYDFHKKKKK
jgi:hypothetical protein